MLLNEFLKEHRQVQELEANAARQRVTRAVSGLESLRLLGVGAASQRLIPTDEQSGLLMRITATERDSLCVRSKS